jgi:hypothetical protein
VLTDSLRDAAGRRVVSFSESGCKNQDAHGKSKKLKAEKENEGVRLQGVPISSRVPECHIIPSMPLICRKDSAIRSTPRRPCSPIVRHRT